MAYADDYGERKLGNVGGQFVALEGSEVACGSAAAYYHHTVPHLLVGRYLLERGNDAGGGRRTLHERGIETHAEVEPRGVGEELMDKIAVAGCSGCRDDSHAQGHFGPHEAAVEVDDAFGRQARDYFPSAAHEVAECVGRVNLGDVGREAVGGVKRGRDAYQYLDAAAKLLAGGLGEGGVDAGKCAAPYCGAYAGHGFAREGVFLHQFEVTVARASHVGGLGRHPYAGQSGHAVDGPGYA